MSAGTIQPQGAGNFTVSGTNTYTNPGNYPVTVTISDTGGASAVATSHASVATAALAPASTTSIGVLQGTAYSGPVVSFVDANAQALAGSFTATINWGDGNVTGGSVLQLGGGLFEIAGTNTYKTSGTFTIVVTVNNIQGGSVVLNTSAQVLAGLTGLSGNGGVTNNTQPTFSGTAQPGATISLLVAPSGSTNVVASGRTTVGSNGQWSVQVGPALGNGTYTVTASMVTPGGVMLSSLNLGSVQVDTQGPTVAATSFAPAVRQLSITFQDAGSGLNTAALANAANYSLGLAAKGRLRNFGVTAIQTQAGPAAGQVTELVSFNLGAKVPAGAYVVTLNAPGLTDRAGNSLVETHFVKFPQTSNSPNPNYIAQFSVNKHLVAAGPIVYVPAGERAAARKFGTIVPAHKGRKKG
jgi:hypothetical protein